MPGLLDLLHLRNIFGGLFDPNQPVGNDLPEQGGITGSMNMPDINDPTSFGMDMPDTGGLFGNSYQPLSMDSGLDSSTPAPPVVVPPIEDYNSPNFIGDIGGQQSPQVDQPGFENSIPQLDLAGNARDNNIQNEYDQFMSLYKPEHAAQDRLDAMLSSYPQRHHAGFGRKLGASFLGFFGGPRLAEEAMDPGYHRSLEDWKNQIQPTLAAANAERGNNVNMRQIASGVMTQDMANKRLDRLQNRDTELKGEFGQRMDLSERRFAEKQHEFEEKLKISQAVAKGGVFKVDDSGQAAFYFKDGSKIPVDATFMSAEEKQKYAVEKASAVATAKTTATEKAKRNRVVKASIQDPEDPSKTIEGTLDLDNKEFTPATVEKPNAPKPGETQKPVATVQPKSASQESAANRKLNYATAAEQFKADNPKLRSYITVDKKTGMVDIEKPGLIFGPTEDEYKKMQDAIYAKKSVIPIGGKGQTATITEREIPSKYGNPPKPGLVHVTTPQGGGWATPEEAKAKGWRIDQ